ncbi:MAG TPA: NifB/NifX family molybdenum-iron cluster-binding protein, partial [Syntrophomonas sp.]|nr:NifB/NifX family molybdenum-iron cluster-binding protein [Syntrophomonas sp.]
MEKKWRVAVASLDGKVINEHFGRAKEFYIVDINQDGTYAFIEKRAVAPLCHSGEHAETAMETTVNALHDCVAVLVSRIGAAAKRTLERNKIAVFEQPDYIENALSKLAAYFIKTKFI